MTYDQELIAEGKCPELVWVDTEDGAVTGRCLAPIVEAIHPEDGETDPDVEPFACEGHTREILGWRNQSEAETIEWERRQDEG